MGLGIAPKIAVAVLLALFSIVVDTVLGLRTVDPDVLALSRISRAGWLREMALIRLFGALPSLFAGMKVAISFALVGAIVGEFVGGSSGLGTSSWSRRGSSTRRGCSRRWCCWVRWAPRGVGALDRSRARWPQIPSCYTMTGWRRTESGRPAANIRFNTATLTAASVRWAAKPRARRRGSISAL